MSILLSHNSSLERLRYIPPQVDCATVLDRPLLLKELSHLGKIPSEPELRNMGVLQRPVHRLVPAQRHASVDDVMRVHRCKLDEIAQGLVMSVGPDAFCAGPELTFVQMAGETTLLGAVVLGHELCGSYSHFAQMISGFYERAPLTSVEKIKEALSQLNGMRGARAAREALRWVRDGSASPMETVVSCMLNLPTSMGGFGMVAPELNYEVSLDAAEATIAGSRTVRIDTAYPSVLVGVEFDGLEYHRDAEHDRKRREALAHKGWTIYVLNVDELISFAKLKGKVALLDAVPRRRGAVEPADSEAKELLMRLLNATRFGVGTNNVLFGTSVPKKLVKVHL